MKKLANKSNEKLKLQLSAFNTLFFTPTFSTFNQLIFMWNQNRNRTNEKTKIEQAKYSFKKLAKVDAQKISLHCSFVWN
jgi:arginine utilization protein RocB